SEKPATDSAMMPRSSQLPCFQAAMTPSGTATTTANRRVISASDSVGSTRWPIIMATGCLDSTERPRSPCRICPIQVTNCSGIGRSRPRSARIAAITSAVAWSPARIAAGSPGLRRSIRKTKMATTPMTGMAATRRDRIRRSIVYRLRSRAAAILLLLHVPQDEGRARQQADNLLAVGGGLEIFAQRDVVHHFIGALLHRRGDFLLLGRIGLAGIGIAELLDLRILGPAEPAALLAEALHTGV